jgi:hypothetical protein
MPGKSKSWVVGEKLVCVCVCGVRKFSSRVVGGEDWVVYEVLGNRFSLRLGRTRCMKTLSSLVSDVDFQDYTASAC